jgi:hypothetical protein
MEVISLSQDEGTCYDKKMKIGIVIQGPIHSQGFDSATTIKRNIEEYLRHPSIDHIVASIWKGEQFTYSHPKVTVLHNTPPTGRDVNNRRRQWLSTYQGTRQLQKHAAITHVLKIRTDQYVPASTIDFMSSFYVPKNLKLYKEDPAWKSEIFQEPLLFSSVYRTFPFFVTDFYFAGHVDDMLRLMESNLAFGAHIFQLAPEVDLILKHLFRTDGDFPLTRYERYMDMRRYINAAPSHKIWRYWHALHRLYFGCFPKSVFSKVTWRGMKWTDFHDQRLGEARAKHIVDTYFDFASDWQLLHKDPEAYTQLPRDLSISSHFTKREWFYTVRGIMESFFRKL